MSSLRLRQSHRLAMLEHVRRWWPEEACGLLGGVGGQTECIYLVENIQHSRTGYLMDPGQQIRAMLEMEAAGWELCSIFHSHPDGPAHPSATDIVRAYYPDAIYIILAPGVAPDWTVRGFEIAADHVQEVLIETTA